MTLLKKSLTLLSLTIILISQSCLRYEYSRETTPSKSYLISQTNEKEGLIPYQEGIASWYGGKFHGRLTASGEVYNMYDMTAAHKVLPLGSIVVVENLENGKRVTVKINDRGPFVKGRIIDMSYAAAKKLGFAEKGLARVRIYLVDKNEASGICYAVQLGAFFSESNAERFVEILAKEGIEARVKKVGDYYKVYSGFFKSKESAKEFGESTGRDYFVVNCN